MAKYVISPTIRSWQRFPGEFIIGQVVSPLAEIAGDDYLCELRLGFGPHAPKGTQLMRIPKAYLEPYDVGYIDLQPNLPPPTAEEVEEATHQALIEHDQDLRDRLRQRLAGNN